MKNNMENKYDVLDRVKARVEWIAWVEAEKKKQQDADEKERGSFFKEYGFHYVRVTKAALQLPMLQLNGMTLSLLKRSSSLKMTKDWISHRPWACQS